MKYFVHFANRRTWDRECGKLYPMYNSKSGEYLVDERDVRMRVTSDPSLFQRGGYMYVEFVQC